VSFRRRGLAAAVLAVAALSACGTSAPTPRHTTASANATRWWSDAAGPVGSTVEVAHPAAAAARLRPARPDYCRMLAQTVAAGRALLPAAGDRGQLAVTEAFVAEISAVAPAAVAASWQVLGAAVLAIVRSGGQLATVSGVDATAVRRAEAAISADAQRGCHLDLAGGG
jgi:hypothetical protein